MDYIKEIAKILSANYYNVSLRENESSDSITMKTKVLSRIFDEDSEINIKDFSPDLHFSRNILIVGAGAAISELPFFLTGNGAIKAIEKRLKLDEIFESFGKFEKRYRSLASHYYKTVYSEDTKIDDIQKQLAFEGRLSLLLDFFDKQDVIDEIKNILDFQHLYCQFYDIAAQLFKHRFIDVIVNFNFDELLDNAIEEEIGTSGMYHKIVQDSDCKPIKDYVESKRLKIPIYIKPHGTISSKTSLLFTKEHYIDMSEEMRNLLHGIFMGKVGEDNSNQNNINVIIAGFAMASIDLNNILFSLQQDNHKNIKYYFLNLNPESEIDEFEESYKKWKKDNNVKSVKHLECRPINTGYDKDRNLDNPNLSEHFSRILNLVQEKFKKPFIPIALNEHSILSILFPKSKLELIGEQLLKEKDDEYLTYLKYRFIFHLLIELVKWKGKLAINVIVKERAGKYYNHYKSLLKQKTKENYQGKNKAENELKKLPDIINYLNENLNISIKSFSPSSDNIYKCENLFMNNSASDLKKDINTIVDIMIENSLIIKEENISEKRDLIFDYLRNKVYDSKMYDVSPLYNDIKHARFRHFDNEKIITTSLNLTFKFFEFAVLLEEIEKKILWDSLWFASETGTPIFNLHKHCDIDRAESYLEMIAENGNNPKKVRLLYSEDKVIKVNEKTFRDPKEGENASFMNVNGLLEHFLDDNFECKCLETSLNIHNMALFLKGDEPVFGFYFFRPEAKTRINPVWFDSKGDKDSNDYKNLDSMKDLFKNQYDRAKYKSS